MNKDIFRVQQPRGVGENPRDLDRQWQQASHAVDTIHDTQQALVECGKGGALARDH